MYAINLCVCVLTWTRVPLCRRTALHAMLCATGNYAVLVPVKDRLSRHGEFPFADRTVNSSTAIGAKRVVRYGIWSCSGASS